MSEIYDVDKMCLGQKAAVGTSGLPEEEEVHGGRQLLGFPWHLPVSLIMRKMGFLSGQEEI